MALQAAYFGFMGRAAAMTEEHVWVTIGGKPLYVGKSLEPAKTAIEYKTYEELQAAYERLTGVKKAPMSFDEMAAKVYPGKTVHHPVAKPKRRRTPYTPPQEIIDAD